MLAGTPVLLIIAALLSAPAQAQGPGSGVSKTTYTATSPMAHLAFLQRYFPVTPALDSGPANIEGETLQGRGQLVIDGYDPGRTCQLFRDTNAARLQLESLSSSQKCLQGTSADCNITVC